MSRILIVLAIILSLLLISSCDGDDTPSAGNTENYKASCSTKPSGDHITLLAGIDVLYIALTYSVPCNVGPMCVSGNFKATMNSNIFFGPEHVLDEWTVPAGLGNSRDLAMSTQDWEGTDHIIIQIRCHQTGETILSACDFTLTAIDPRPDNPDLSSPTHSKGQPSCERIMTVTWPTPAATRGVGGYSYVILSQDDPAYDDTRTPDSAPNLDASATSFTTEALEPGHIWEFNIKTIDAEGLAAKYYASYWVEICACEVNITRPRTGDSFAAGEWINIFWDPVTFGGNDVGAGYNVDSVALLKGADVITYFVSNQANINSFGLSAPNTEPGSDYRIRVILGRNAAGDAFSYLPETMMGMSSDFSIVP